MREQRHIARIFGQVIGPHFGLIGAPVEQVCQALAYLGVQLDATRNAKATGDDVAFIHAYNSAIDVWVVPTDEGRVAAEEAIQLLHL